MDEVQEVPRTPKKRAPVKRQASVIWLDSPSCTKPEKEASTQELLKLTQQLNKLEQRFSQIEELLLQCTEEEDLDL